jgi:hypothetical protein
MRIAGRPSPSVVTPSVLRVSDPRRGSIQSIRLVVEVLAGGTAQRGFVRRRERLPWIARPRSGNGRSAFASSRRRVDLPASVRRRIATSELVSLPDDYDRHRALSRFVPASVRAGPLGTALTVASAIGYYLDHERRALVVLSSR